MINQIKIQLNLYSHREKDNCIINKLGLDTSPNPNNTVKDLLYSFATGNDLKVNVASGSNVNIEEYTQKIKELELMLKKKDEENIYLKAENSVLKNQIANTSILNSSNDIVATKTENIPTKKNHTKLTNSIKQMDI